MVSRNTKKKKKKGKRETRGEEGGRAHHCRRGVKRTRWSTCVCVFVVGTCECVRERKRVGILTLGRVTQYTSDTSTTRSPCEEDQEDRRLIRRSFHGGARAAVKGEDRLRAMRSARERSRRGEEAAEVFTEMVVRVRMPRLENTLEEVVDTCRR